jgi:hypothetical protein
MVAAGILPNERWLEDHRGTFGALGADSDNVTNWQLICFRPTWALHAPFISVSNQVRCSKVLYSTSIAILRSAVAVKE